MGNYELGHGVSWCKRKPAKIVKTVISTKRRVDCPRITVMMRVVVMNVWQ